MQHQTVASRATTQTASHSSAGAIPTSHLSALLGAYNATALASSYLERGNLKAARRKLVLALRDVDTLAAAQATICASPAAVQGGAV